MALLFETHEAFADHDAGRFHPERPARLDAVLAGVDRAGIREALVPASPDPASRSALERVHRREHLDHLEAFSASGGGHLDPDTAVTSASWGAAVLAAGAGLDAVDRLRAGEATAAFCAVRPPGHHATAESAMGFCLLNNVAVCAAALVADGERVAVIDWDAHHGNGTEEIFADIPQVLYVSIHEFGRGVYPGTGGLPRRAVGDDPSVCLNVPLPSGARWDAYLAAFDALIDPVVERFAPTWVLLSAGFDAHRDDPLTHMGLSAGDYGELTARSIAHGAPGRVVAFLEGGYDLEAVANSAGACMAALLGERWVPEPPSEGAGIGLDVVAEARRRRGL